MSELEILKFWRLHTPHDHYDVVAKLNFVHGEFRITGVHLCTSHVDRGYFVQIPGKKHGDTRAITITNDSPLRAEILYAAIERYEEFENG